VLLKRRVDGPQRPTRDGVEVRDDLVDDVRVRSRVKDGSGDAERGLRALGLGGLDGGLGGRLRRRSIRESGGGDRGTRAICNVSALVMGRGGKDVLERLAGLRLGGILRLEGDRATGVSDDGVLRRGRVSGRKRE
jgi:hypothetical protein